MSSRRGPVARELRRLRQNDTALELSAVAFTLYNGARKSLGISDDTLTVWGPGARFAPDILSEAIEAAEALGL